MAERRTIVIDPVTRIEGHAKITLHLDEQGKLPTRVSMSPSFAASKSFAKAGPLPRCPR